MKALCLIAAGLLAGCTTAKPVYLQDGRQGHVVDCSGTARNWSHCQAKAGELCGARGYEVLSNDQQNSFVHNTAFGNNQVIPTASRSMMIACR